MPPAPCATRDLQPPAAGTEPCLLQFVASLACHSHSQPGEEFFESWLSFGVAKKKKKIFRSTAKGGLAVALEFVN